MIKHQDEAMDILQDQLKLDIAYIKETWNENQFSLTLDLSLIIAMNDEARWMMINNLTAEKTIPDFRNYIYVEGLKAVKPEVVNISE